MAVLDRTEIGFLLNNSINQNFRGFSVCYQPQVLHEKHRLYGAEALVRWHCSRYGDVSPEVFIPILEENGRIVELDQWIFEQAVKQCKEWYRFQPDFRMSINFSCRYLEKGNMCKFVESTLKRIGVDGSNIMLELTETWPLNEKAPEEDVVFRLHEMGIKLAMDDFGSGYSSLLSLQKYPFHTVKIDKFFVKDMGKRGRRQALVQSITQLCHNIGREICLEGVETQKEYEEAKKLGIEVLQGYYFGHPVSAKEFEIRYFS